MSAFTGGCLCGAVRYQSIAAPVMSGHCHCNDCRRSSATGHGSHIVIPAAAFELTGLVKGYARAADSGAMVTRYFCPECGAAIYSTNDSMPDMVFPRASSLDDLEVFKPQMIVYAKRAASWDVMDEKLPRFEAMPPQMPD